MGKTTKFFHSISRALHLKSCELPACVRKDDEVVTSPEDVKEAIRNYWANLYQPSPPLHSRLPFCYSAPSHHFLPEDSTFFTADITAEELSSTIQSLKNDSAPGKDHIPYELFKALSTDNTQLLANCLNEALRAANLPESWVESSIFTIFKKGDRLHPGNYRPISLCQTTYKLLTLILNNRLTKLVDLRNILSPNQAAFRKSYTTHHQILTLKLLIEEAKYRGIPLLALFLDFEKAYDSLPHDAIPLTLKFYGLSEEAVQLIMKLYSNTIATVSTRYGPTKPFHISRGVKQGDPLSPLLWNLFINPLAYWLHDNRNGYRISKGPFIGGLLFADDTTAISSSKEGLSALYKGIEEFCLFHHLRINPSKSVLVSTSNAPPPSLLWNNNPIPSKTGDDKTITYLGARINFKLDRPNPLSLLQEHRKNLNFILNRKLQPETKAFIINTYLIPKIAYSLTTSPLAKSYTDRMDSAARRLLYRDLRIFGQSNHNAIYGGKGSGIGLHPIKATQDSLFCNTILKILNQGPTLTKQILLNNLELYNGRYHPSPINHWRGRCISFPIISTLLLTLKEYGLQPFSPKLFTSSDPRERGTSLETLFQLDLEGKPWPHLPPISASPQSPLHSPEGLIAFTDGSATDGRAGSAAVLLSTPPTIFMERTPHEQNNNSAEIYAAIMAIRAVSPNTPLTIITDSLTTIKTPNQHPSMSIGPPLLRSLIHDRPAQTTLLYIPSHIEDKLRSDRAKWTECLQRLDLPIPTAEATKWNEDADKAAKEAANKPLPPLEHIATNASHMFFITLNNGSPLSNISHHIRSSAKLPYTIPNVTPHPDSFKILPPGLYFFHLRRLHKTLPLRNRLHKLSTSARYSTPWCLYCLQKLGTFCKESHFHVFALCPLNHEQRQDTLKSLPFSIACTSQRKLWRGMGDKPPDMNRYDWTNANTSILLVEYEMYRNRNGFLKETHFFHPPQPPPPPNLADPPVLTD
ncbi:MAG: reverse transcriptase domain-containing protein [Steroidobacteraceae bacterium]